MSDRRPADHIIYKGKAALQFTLKPGSPVQISSSSGKYTGTRKGILFVVAAEAKGEKSYDWENKVTLGLNEHEVGKLMRALSSKTQQSFFHDRNMGDPEKQGQEIKTMSIGPDKEGKTLFVNIAEKKNGQEHKIPGIAVSPDEALTLYTLLQSALPQLLGW